MQWETVDGEPLRTGDLTVTPRSRVLAVWLPFGGFVWHRPTSVIVEQGGNARHIAIVDRTRRIQVGLLAAAAIALVLSRRPRPALRRRR